MNNGPTRRAISVSMFGRHEQSTLQLSFQSLKILRRKKDSHSDCLFILLLSYTSTLIPKLATVAFKPKSSFNLSANPSDAKGSP